MARSAPLLTEPFRTPSHAASASGVRGKTAARTIPGKIAIAIVMILIGFIFILPFAWMTLTSLKPTQDVFRYSFPLTWKTFVPPHPTLANYHSIFAQWHFQRDLMNTLIAAAGQVIGCCVVCPLAGFVFARLRFRGRNFLFALVMLTAFMPLEMIVVPLYSVMRSLHLVSTYPALFLPFIFSPFGIFLMRQAFLDIPRELDEAATMDGASLFRIFWSVVLPNARPALITLALIQFMWSWNNYLWPLVIMQDPAKQVVQVSIAKFQSVQNFPLYGELFAASTAATIPILVLFFLLQRYYVRGMLISGMK
jgi:multiple sugar transport system permease protein